MYEINSFGGSSAEDYFNPKSPGGEGIYPSGTDMACMPSIFIKTSQIFFW